MKGKLSSCRLTRLELMSDEQIARLSIPEIVELIKRLAEEMKIRATQSAEDLAMTWNDFLLRKLPCDPTVTRVKTDIDCPKCGAKIWKRVDRILASNPPQYQYECDCGWTGYHTI